MSMLRSLPPSLSLPTGARAAQGAQSSWRHAVAGLVLAAVLLAPHAGAQAQAAFNLPGNGPTGLNGQIESIERIPGGSFSAVKLSNRGELYMLSANGRFVLRGPVYDLWQGRELASVEEIREAAQTLNLAGLGVVWNDLAPTVIGEGEAEVVVFIDPHCPHCQTLLTQIGRLAAAEPRSWRFMILPVPMLGNRSATTVRNLACATDQAAARRALLEHRFEPALPERADCDLAPAQKRWVLARLLQLEGVPFTIRPDGRSLSGAPQDFAAWLRQSGPRLAGRAVAPGALP